MYGIVLGEEKYGENSSDNDLESTGYYAGDCGYLVFVRVREPLNDIGQNWGAFL